MALPKFSLAAQKIWVAQNLGGLQPPSPPPDPYAYDFKYSLRVDQKNILGEYSWFFKPSTWNYLYLHWINLYRNDLCRNDFVSKRPVTLALRRGSGGKCKKRAWALPKTPVEQANLKNEPELFS